jgi:polyhydroxybutyrate depolymerase
VNSAKRLLVIILILAVTIACRASAQATPIPLATEAPATTEGFLTPEALAPGNYTLSLANGTDQRDVILHIPPAYDGSTQLPLVIVLHGGAQNAIGIQRLSEMDGDADELGFVVAYPNGSGRLGDKILTWNSGYCCGYSLEHNIDDVGFISLLIDNLLSHYSIDPNRVFITGISNGGMMTYRAGAELASKVTAIAPIAASIGGQQNANNPVYTIPQPSSPVAVMAFHGKQDQHVLYDGGVGPAELTFGRIDFSVAQSIDFWVQANGCNPQPATETQADGNIIIETYGGCTNDATVVLVTIVDGGHAWPGAHGGIVGDPPTLDISANEMMLQFFLEHPKGQ